jgi:hypothetical protein
MHLGSPLSMKHIFTHPGEFRDSQSINPSKQLGIGVPGNQQMERDGPFSGGMS